MTLRKFLYILAAFVVALAIGFGVTNNSASVDGFDQQNNDFIDSIDASEIVDVLPRDSIPAILEPKFVDPGDAPWKDSDLVIGLSAGDTARAYPIRVLNWHEIVDDTVEGTPVAVTFCPLCGTGIVFDRRVNGDVLSFGVSGKLYRNDLVMYDHQTESLWTQILGEGISGDNAGVVLKTVPSFQGELGEWKRLHPNTLVLSDDTGFPRDYNADPYLGYASGPQIGISGQTASDPRLEAKALVVGVDVDGAPAAFSINTLSETGVLHGTVGEEDIVVFYDRESSSATAFKATSGGRSIEFTSSERHMATDTLTGSVWSTTDGTAISGALAGQQLEQVTGTQVFWFAWSEFHPDTDLIQ